MILGDFPQSNLALLYQPYQPLLVVLKVLAHITLIDGGLMTVNRTLQAVGILFCTELIRLCAASDCFWITTVSSCHHSGGDVLVLLWLLGLPVLGLGRWGGLVLLIKSCLIWLVV